MCSHGENGKKFYSNCSKREGPVSSWTFFWWVGGKLSRSQHRQPSCPGLGSTCLWAAYHSVQFSRSIMLDSLRPHGLQHARLPCPSPTPGACSNSCPLSWWCHPTISSSVVPFSSCLQSFPTWGSFQWVSFLHQVAKVLEFHFSISHSNW